MVGQATLVINTLFRVNKLHIMYDDGGVEHGQTSYIGNTGRARKI